MPILDFDSLSITLPLVRLDLIAHSAEFCNEMYAGDSVLRLISIFEGLSYDLQTADTEVRMGI